LPHVPLTPAEKAEIESSLRNPERFHSDGRETTIACAVIPLLCVALMAVLFGDARSQVQQVLSGELSLGTSLIFFAPELFGFSLLLLIAIAVAVYGLRTFRRHGVVVTTFGVARVRGSVKKLIRFGEIEKIVFSEHRWPMHKVITDELEVKAKDGRSIVLYGFSVGLWKARIEERMRCESSPPR
jgi:hypothetical protein